MTEIYSGLPIGYLKFTLLLHAAPCISRQYFKGLHVAACISGSYFKGLHAALVVF